MASKAKLLLSHELCPFCILVCPTKFAHFYFWSWPTFFFEFSFTHLTCLFISSTHFCQYLTIFILTPFSWFPPPNAYGVWVEEANDKCNYPHIWALVFAVCLSSSKFLHLLEEMNINYLPISTTTLTRTGWNASQQTTTAKLLFNVRIQSAILLALFQLSHNMITLLSFFSRLSLLSTGWKVWWWNHHLKTIH